jgi:hypothetical protein
MNINPKFSWNIAKFAGDFLPDDMPLMTATRTNQFFLGKVVFDNVLG